MIERIILAWRDLSARERRLVASGAALLFLALGWLLAFEPAWKGREKLTNELPTLRAQVSQTARLADEARRLSAAPAPVETPAALRDALEASLKDAGLDARLERLQVSGQLIDLRFKSVRYTDWLDWLDAAQRETRLRVADIALSREAAPGVVSVRLVFEAPGREGR